MDDEVEGDLDDIIPGAAAAGAATAATGAAASAAISAGKMIKNT